MRRATRSSLTGARQGVLGRRRHPRVQHAESERRARAALGDPHAGGQAASRSSPRSTASAWAAGSSSRWAATIASRTPAATIALAGGEARPPARRRRHAAAAARDRRGERRCNMIVTGASVPASDAARHRACSTRSSTATSSTAALALGAQGRRGEAAAQARCATSKHRLSRTPTRYFQFARNTVGARRRSTFPRRSKCVDAVAAAVSDAVRRRACVRAASSSASSLQTPESRALRHAFFAERAAARIADVPDTTPARTIERVAIIGAGTMGGGIAMNFLVGRHAGRAARDRRQDALDKGVATIRENYEASVEEGQAHARQGRRRACRCCSRRCSTTISRDADLVIEAVFEDMAIKRDGVRDARRRREARRDPRDQHVDARRRTRSPRRPGGRRTSSACTSSVRPT